MFAGKMLRIVLTFSLNIDAFSTFGAKPTSAKMFGRDGVRPGIRST
jgi:hypothetical protein